MVLMIYAFVRMLGMAEKKGHPLGKGGLKKEGFSLLLYLQ